MILLVPEIYVGCSLVPSSTYKVVPDRRLVIIYARAYPSANPPRIWGSSEVDRYQFSNLSPLFIASSF